MKAAAQSEYEPATSDGHYRPTLKAQRDLDGINLKSMPNMYACANIFNEFKTKCRI